MLRNDCLVGNTPAVVALPRKARGLTLIELLIALVIAAGLLFGIFFLVNVANDRTIVREETQAFNSMINDVRTKFRAQGTYAGITPAIMIQLGLVPPNMINGNVIRTGWNTNLAVAPINLNGQANDGIAFTYTMPRRSCPDFVDGVQAAVSRITIGADVVKDIPNGVNVVNIPAVAAACDAGAAGNVNVQLSQGR